MTPAAQHVMPLPNVCLLRTPAAKQQLKQQLSQACGVVLKCSAAASQTALQLQV
jgi:hypothetical protein